MKLVTERNAWILLTTSLILGICYLLTNHWIFMLLNTPIFLAAFLVNYIVYVVQVEEGGDIEQ